MTRKTNDLNVNGTLVRVLRVNDADYICISDIAALKNPVEPKDVVKNWMRNRATISFLGLWERLHNPEFKGVDFDPLLRVAGDNAFTMSPTRWIESFNAIGIYCKVGRNGVPQPQRLKRLNEIAIQQMKVLAEAGGRNLLK